MDLCVRLEDEKLQALKEAIDQALQAAGSEDKSSAGDKHETARAMAQLEQEKLYKQQAEAVQRRQLLNRIILNEKPVESGLGCIVHTNRGKFFLAIAIGKLEHNGADYFVISPASPIGSQLLGKKEGEGFSFNGMQYDITVVE